MVEKLTETDIDERGKWMKIYKRKKFTGKLTKVTVVVFLLVAVVGVVSFKLWNDQRRWSQSQPSAPSAAVEGELKQFANYEELKAFLKENVSEESSAGAYTARSGLKTFAMPETTSSITTMGLGASSAAPASALDDAASTQASSADYSATNVQVAGVDEADIVKTDGNYIYAVKEQAVLIFSALPAQETKLVSTITLGYYPNGLFVDGDRLVVFGSGYDIKPLKEYMSLVPNRRNPFSDLRIYDVSDRNAPKLKKQYDFEGDYRDSRKIGDYIYLVTQTSPSYSYYRDYPVPYVLEDGAVSAMPAQPTIFYFGGNHTGESMTSVNAVNIKDETEDPRGETYLLDADQSVLYMSEKNLYLTYSQYMSETQLMTKVLMEYMLAKLPAEDQEKVREISAVKRFILSDEDKAYKISEVFARYMNSLDETVRAQYQKQAEELLKSRSREIMEQLQKTLVYKIGVDGGTLSLAGKGEVPGRVINQYAMDEAADGSLRVATTIRAAWLGLSGDETKAYNNLFVLGSDMKRVGALEDIAKGETIQSVRFLGDRAYMVTFLRTDPLFVIDVKDAASPKVLGELKVPGFSTYLHPYDDNLLIGLGQNADENGRVIDGIKLSLFDTADVNNPKEVGKYLLGDYGSSSSALNDPRAFLFSKEKQLLVIPAVVRKGNGENRYDTSVSSSGAAVFRVTPQGFELRGVVDHRTESERATKYAGEEAKRSLYIGDNLYSYSDKFLKVNSLADFSNLKEISLPFYDGREMVPMPASSMPATGTGGSAVDSPMMDR